MTDYLKSILSSFHDLLFVFREDGVIDDCISTNHKDELLLPKEEFLGKNHSEVLPPFLSNKITQAFHEIDQGKDRYKFDYSIDKNGEVQWYSAILSKIDHGDTPHYLGSVRNITERKKQEEKLAELNRHKDKLFSVISHDLRNAVAGSQGVYHILFEDYETFSKEEILEFLKLVKKRTDSTQELLEDLLAWANNQFQEVTADFSKVQLNKLTDLVVNNVRSLAEDKGILLENKISDSIYLYADENMTKTILRNLVVNGIKFSESGDTVTIQATETGSHVDISVVDEGIGMKKKVLEEILDKKSTYTAPGTDGEKGSGLGLDLCIDFVEMHGGTIRAESEPGKGSRFTFTLPRFEGGK